MPFAAYMPTIDSGASAGHEGDEDLLASNDDYKLFESATKDNRASAEISV